MKKARNSIIGLSAAAIVMIAGYEGYRGYAYDDGVGVQTIGFGTTENVKPGDKIDPVRALGLLYRDANEMTEEITRCVGEVPVYQHEADAFISLAYNIGSGAFCRSTLVKKLKQSPPDYIGACNEILRWNKAGGQVMQGLTNRRMKEYQLCMQDKTKVAIDE